MMYIFRFHHWVCNQLEGYTNNEFIFRQYVKMISRSYRCDDYELLTEDLSEEELLEKYKFHKFQRFRIYTSADKTVVLCCNPLFMNEWLGAGRNTLDVTNHKRVPVLMSWFLNATVSLYQIINTIMPEKQAEFHDLFRKLLVYAVNACELDDHIFDQVKLILYVNKFPYWE